MNKATEERKPKARLYMNIEKRSVHYAKPGYVDHPKMVPFYGEMPPIHPTIGLRIVPKEELGPQFGELASDEEIRPTMTMPVPEVEPHAVKEEDPNKEERMELIAKHIGDLKKFDFTSAGIPKVDKLSLACGFPVSGPERDQAYALFLEAKSIED